MIATPIRTQSHDAAAPSPEGRTIVARGADRSTEGRAIKPLESALCIPARRADESHAHGHRQSLRRSCFIAFLTALCALSGESVFAAPPAIPERIEAAHLPSTPDSVDQLLAAPYLSPDQLKDTRIRFGRYSGDDLDSPARVARAALQRAVYDDPALAADDADADPLDRAEAAYFRADLPAALKLLDALPSQTPRSIRIRAAILEDQGKFNDALRIADPILADLAAHKLTSSDDIVEAVRLGAQRIRLRGPASLKDGAGGGAANDYKQLLAHLDTIVNTTDRLSWPAMIAQADLLSARDNKQEAAAVLSRALELNPSSAAAWAMLGRLMVESFAFPQAEGIAKRLDLLASDWSGADPDPLPAELAAADPGSISTDGAMIAARILLRQSEGAQALKVLEPALARAPKSPRLLALKCAALAVSFDFKAADAALADFDSLVGQSPLAHYEVGKALSESRQYTISRTHLEEAARRQPNAPEPYIELGLMLMQAGKDADALIALDRAFALDPFNARADNSLRLARELQSYEKIETPHYIIRCKPGPNTDGGPSDTILARDMAGPLERNYDIVTGSQPGGIDYQPKEKTLIDLMPDHRWFGVRIAGMPAIHTIAASTGPIIAMESPRDGANHLGTYDWVRVLRHEFTHTVTLGRTSNRIPHWFTEASAVYLEQAPRDWNTCQLLAAAHRQGKLFDFSQINISFVRPKKPTDRSQAYAQGHWMYEYIVERSGAKAPLELMDKYAQGVREEEAFQSVLHISRAQFLADFITWSRQQIIDWGLDVPDGTPVLHQLQAREALLIQNPGGNAGASPTQNPGGNAGANGATDNKADNKADNKPDAAPPSPEAEAAMAEARKAEQDHKLALQRIADGHPTEDDDQVDLPEPTPEWIAKWLAEFPRHPDVLELAMDEAIEKNKGRATPEIEPLIDRYAAARPVDPKPHRLLAKMYLDAAAANPANLNAQAAKAIPHLEFLDAREQKLPTYAMELARRYAALGEMDKAVASAERATQIDPFNAPTRELAATIALQAHDLAGAERHIAALTQIEPTREIHKQRLEAVRKMREHSTP